MKNSSFPAAQGAQKLLLYFERIEKTNSFQKRIKNIRQKLGFPDKGYINKNVKDPGMLWWLHIVPDKKEYLDEELEKICEKYGFYRPLWTSAILGYIRNGEFINADLFYGELCYLVHTSESHHTPTAKTIDKHYPLAIRISPFATKRDILSYIQFIYPVIKIYQKEYKIPGLKIGRIRGRNPIKKARDEFIYNHRKLSLRDLTILVEEKFRMFLDEGHIGKIISLEEKRRKKV